MKRLFVAMPYGARKAPLDPEDPDKTCIIDFDNVWKELLKPAVPKGFVTERADTLYQSGLIDRLYNEWLFDADIVLADLTFGNPNVYYELGIRQALSKKGTVLVACKGTRLAFDVQNQRVFKYDYFTAIGQGVFRRELRKVIANAALQELDSPVHVFLPGLVVKRYPDGESPESRIEQLMQRVQELEAALRDQRSQDEEERLREKLREATTTPRLLNLHQLISTREIKSIRLLEQLAIRLRDVGCFDEALLTLDRALKMAPNDPELLRETGFTYRKKGPLFYSQAETYMERSLQLNDRDSELHGMLGGLYRRRGEYERALARYQRAHELESENLYPLVTIAAIYGAVGKVREASEWYQKLQTTCEKLIQQERADHWTYLCLGEAAVALGDQETARAAYRKALSSNPPVEHVRSEAEQLEFLIEKNFAAENAQKVLPILREYLTAHASQ